MVNSCVVLFLASVTIVAPSADGAEDTSACDPDVPSRPMPAPTARSLTPGACSKGQYILGQECAPCEEGTFMTAQMAESGRYLKCLPCQELGENEIIAEACNRTRDALIMCEKGFYRNRSEGKACESGCIRCSVCGATDKMFLNYEMRHCSGNSNVVCCHDEGMSVVDDVCVYNTTASATSKIISTENGNDETKNASGATSVRSHLFVFIAVFFMLQNFIDARQAFCHWPRLKLF